MGGSLVRSAAKGAIWVGLSEILAQGLSLGSQIVLARVLLPADFGVVAMAAVVNAVAYAVIDLGFNEAIIQRKEITQDHLSTAFWVICAMGITLCIITIAISPLVADFYGNELVGPVLRLSSLSFIITSSGAVHGALLRRRMEFSKFSVASLSETAIYLVASVSMAFAGLGIWSLVLGGLAGEIGYVSLRWVLCRWHPSIRFSLKSLKDLRKFGLNVMAAKVVYYATVRLDNLMIGKFMSSAAVGFYNLGGRTVAQPADVVRLSLSRVILPAFSMIQDEEERLRRGFIRSTAFLSLMALPIFTGLALVTPELIKVVFGEKWAPAIPPMQILCIMGAVTLIGRTNTPLFQAKGRPDIDLKFSLLNIAVLVPCLVIGIRFGTVGVALGESTAAIILWLIRQIFANRLINLSMRDYFLSLLPAAVGSAVMAVAVLVVRYGLKSLAVPDVGVLVSSILFGTAIYFVAMKVGHIKTFNEMVALFTEIITSYVRIAVTKIRPVQKVAVQGPGKSHEETIS
jgi:PST family polysaccharide transporter